jgi:hypothetical protein
LFVDPGIEPFLVPELTLDQVQQLCRNRNVPGIDDDFVRAAYERIGGVAVHWIKMLNKPTMAAAKIDEICRNAKIAVDDDAEVPSRAGVLKRLANAAFADGTEADVSQNRLGEMHSFHNYNVRFYAHTTAHYNAIRNHFAAEAGTAQL